MGVDKTNYLPLEYQILLLNSENTFNNDQEPLIDIFDENDTVKIYVELSAEVRNKIRLKVFRDNVEFVAGNFYRVIPLPTCNIKREKICLNFKSCLLEVIIPKRDG
ncbi:MAG: hypothetical protein ACUVQX_00580 [Candidatus Bathycorpusculaceae bacterium]